MNPVCWFCNVNPEQPPEQATTVRRGKPCCENCADYIDEMDYDDYQAEDGYARLHESNKGELRE